jgi:hypothetical protein
MLVQPQGLLVLNLLAYVAAIEEVRRLHQAEVDFKAA